MTRKENPPLHLSPPENLPLVKHSSSNSNHQPPTIYLEKRTICCIILLAACTTIAFTTICHQRYKLTEKEYCLKYWSDRRILHQRNSNTTTTWLSLGTSYNYGALPPAKGCIKYENQTYAADGEENGHESSRYGNGNGEDPDNRIETSNGAASGGGGRVNGESAGAGLNGAGGGLG
jgi:hypothetical protein